MPGERGGCVLNHHLHPQVRAPGPQQARDHRHHEKTAMTGRRTVLPSRRTLPSSISPDRGSRQR
eukprot:10754864-Alexandrium_andersonii.AAC.1